MKYVVFTIDDGTIYDERLISLMNKYHIKGTFNLNSGLDGYIWNNNGTDIKRGYIRENISLYTGHEVACHSYSHPRLDLVSEDKLTDEIFRDKGNLEGIFEKPVEGFAIPFDTYNEHVIDKIREAGFSYARIPALTDSYHHKEDNYHLSCNAFTFQSDLNWVLDDFKRRGTDNDILIIAGHSYEFYLNNSWSYIEGVFKRLSEEESMQSVTTMDALKFTGRL